jgi:hypothetical protein
MEPSPALLQALQQRAQQQVQNPQGSQPQPTAAPQATAIPQQPQQPDTSMPDMNAMLQAGQKAQAIPVDDETKDAIKNLLMKAIKLL